MSDLDDVIDQNGPLVGVRPVPDAYSDAYRGKVPQLLLDLWRTQGVGAWKKGVFTLCLPDDLRGLLSQVFQADKDFSHADCHVFAYGAFGVVHAWSERHGLVEINLLRSEVIANGLSKTDGKAKPDKALTVLLFLLSENDSLDAFDDDGKKLFARAVRKIGCPGPGQAFGFFPALAMGGAPKLENIRIVPALEHFLFLAQLQQFQLVDYLSHPPRVVRMIG